jgi:RNA polymerase sigma factor (sigma-70 family)
MNPLVELALRYRSSPDMDVRLHAAEELIKAMGPSLWLYIAHRCRTVATAEDAYQEALQKIVHSLPAFRGRTDAQLWSYCYQIAWCCVADEYRGGWANLVEIWDPAVLREAVGAGAGEESDSAATQADLHAVLELLKCVQPPCYGLLWIRYIDGLDFKTIGKTYGISAAAAKVRVYRCLALAQKLAKKLAKQLSAEGD